MSQTGDNARTAIVLALRLLRAEPVGIKPTDASERLGGRPARVRTLAVDAGGGDHAVDRPGPHDNEDIAGLAHRT